MRAKITLDWAAPLPAADMRIIIEPTEMKILELKLRAKTPQFLAIVGFDRLADGSAIRGIRHVANTPAAALAIAKASLERTVSQFNTIYLAETRTPQEVEALREAFLADPPSPQEWDFNPFAGENPFRETRTCKS